MRYSLSHYDHVLDAPEVAKLLGGRIHGSASTLNVGHGSGLEEKSLQMIRENDVYAFGDFKVRVFEGLHSPGNTYPGTIDEPLTLPRKARDMKDGGCYSFYITHPEGNMLIHPSANFVPGMFSDIDVDVLYLGIGMLGAQSAEFQENYWMHTVEATRPRLLVPIHWDNFFKPLSDILQPIPAFLDHFTASKTFIDRKVGESGLKVLWQGPLETIAAFDTNNTAERDEASQRVKLWETNRSLFAWVGSFFNARQVITFGCIGLLFVLYKHAKSDPCTSYTTLSRGSLNYH
jgi:L-ascorbate metabolism protein UlaG (beta-lactamase superfamily)